jgi:hypothetical protein
MVQDDLEDEAPVLVCVCVKPAIIMRVTPANKLQSINFTCSGGAGRCEALDQRRTHNC